MNYIHGRGARNLLTGEVTKREPHGAKAYTGEKKKKKKEEKPKGSSVMTINVRLLHGKGYPAAYCAQEKTGWSSFTREKAG